jgi:hypothetical protein
VRVIAKDSSAPTAVVTPLPAESARAAAKSQGNAPAQVNAPGSTGDRMSLAAAPAEAKPEEIQTGSISGDFSMPRPAPESIRKPPPETASPQPTVREPGTVSERAVRRESRERAKLAKAQKADREQKSERQRLTRAQPSVDQEARGVERRQAGVVESRAYQLPSGRRIVVFRQANGEVGIAPDRRSDGGSFFFGW